MASNDERSSMVPPHANAAVHKRIMARLGRMTREEGLSTLIKAGIATPKKRLTKSYRNGSRRPNKAAAKR